MVQSLLSERLEAATVDKTESVELSPLLTEREKFLECSAKELQEKLSCVRNEIQNLSSGEEQSSSMLGGCQTVVSPDRFGFS